MWTNQVLGDGGKYKITTKGNWPVNLIVNGYDVDEFGRSYFLLDDFSPWVGSPPKIRTDVKTMDPLQYFNKLVRERRVFLLKNKNKKLIHYNFLIEKLENDLIHSGFIS